MSSTRADRVGGAEWNRSGAVHGEKSECVVERLSSGSIRIIEQFTRTTRLGFGTNVLDEILN